MPTNCNEEMGSFRNRIAHPFLIDFLYQRVEANHRVNLTGQNDAPGKLPERWAEVEMRRALISTLIERLKTLYPETYVPYGTSDDEAEGTGFRILDIPAAFSVLSFGDMPEDRFDIQIESFPPGDYIYNEEASLEELMELIEVYRKPMNDWP